MSSSFSFPLLSNADILSCLEELGSDIREQELLRPTYEVLRPIYENLVMLLVGLTREEIHQPMVMAMDDSHCRANPRRGKVFPVKIS